MHTLAQELNKVIEGTTLYNLLSDYGKRIYFPKGIVFQSGEAAKKATHINATVGIALGEGEPLHLPSIKSLLPDLSARDIFAYAPNPGIPELRSIWKEEMIEKNQSLKDSLISTPMVTAGLTHGLAIIGDLFLDKGDTLLIPDIYWGNYNLIFSERCGVSIETYPLFKKEDTAEQSPATPQGGGMHLEALRAKIAASPKKVVLLFNFPNNFAGYTPTKEEAAEIVSIIKEAAEGGKELLVITDDAYFGLFYEEGSTKESLFGPLSSLHKRVITVKLDAATKEELAWGFRVGFATFGGKELTPECIEVIEKKTMGAIRGTVSNCPKVSQSLLLKGMQSPTYKREKEEIAKIMQNRYNEVKRVLAENPSSFLRPLPFNSGYFMAFTATVDTEKLRVHLLDTYQIGTISIGGTYLRVAFSSVDFADIENLYKTINKAAEEVAAGR